MMAIQYEKSTHAPVYEKYNGGGFEPIGDEPEPGMPWRIDPDTGAELHALGGPDGRFSGDLKVGSYYPATTFIFGLVDGGEPADHDALEAFLREHGLWADRLRKVAVPRSGDAPTKPGFQYGPDQQPYSLDSVAERVARAFDLDDHELLDGDHGFTAYVGE